ncbi:MAG: hydrogenase maturation nickel metallochaperone HypA [candidate division Zixibacteria bacterium]|nr:hydrogenase maturation nickel metallochaperone HypA [candidate division Zixibacteria bacterium]
MHELAMADSIVTGVLEEIGRRGITRVLAVGLEVGELMDVVPDSLKFGFEVAVRGTELAGARLEITEVPLTAECPGCTQSFRVEKYLFVCPICGNRDINVLTGKELRVTFLEIDDDA